MTYHEPIHLGGGLYYYSAVIRLLDDGPYIHSNSSHANVGVKRVQYRNGGLQIDMDNSLGRMEICHGTIQGDETITGRFGCVGGPTGGSGGSFTAKFFDTRVGRRLDLDDLSDRARITHTYSNTWFQCTRLLVT